jgi:hypothetical protein
MPPVSIMIESGVRRGSACGGIRARLAAMGLP